MEQYNDRILDFEINSNFFSILNNETNTDEFLFNPYENIDVRCQYFDSTRHSDNRGRTRKVRSSV